MTNISNVVLVKDQGDPQINQLDLENSTSAKIALPNLLNLNLRNSSVGIIEGKFNDLDIQSGSLVDVLNVSIYLTKAELRNVTVGDIDQLTISGPKIFHFESLKIRKIKSFIFEGLTKVNQSPLPVYGVIKNTSIDYVSQKSIRIGNSTKDNFLLENVSIKSIAEHGITVRGNLEINNCTIESIHDRGIFIDSDGKITFNNVTIRGKRLSYGIWALNKDFVYPIMMCLPPGDFTRETLLLITVCILGFLLPATCGPATCWFCERICGHTYFAMMPIALNRNRADECKTEPTSCIERLSANRNTKTSANTKGETSQTTSTNETENIYEMPLAVIEMVKF